VLQGKVPLVKKLRDRNSRLNKTDKTDNFFFARDIKNESKFHPSIDRWNIK
jgi:hypothetical protein